MGLSLSGAHRSGEGLAAAPVITADLATAALPGLQDMDAGKTVPFGRQFPGGAATETEPEVVLERDSDRSVIAVIGKAQNGFASRSTAPIHTTHEGITGGLSVATALILGGHGGPITDNIRTELHRAA